MVSWMRSRCESRPWMTEAKRECRRRGGAKADRRMEDSVALVDEEVVSAAADDTFGAGRLWFFLETIATREDGWPLLDPGDRGR
jgi:hypothetical protein